MYLCVEKMERAQAIDPASEQFLADKGRILYVLGRRQKEANLIQQREGTEPDFVSPRLAPLPYRPRVTSGSRARGRKAGQGWNTEPRRLCIRG